MIFFQDIKLYSTGILFLLICLPAPVPAQSKAEPKKFYERGYVTQGNSNTHIPSLSESGQTDHKIYNRDKKKPPIDGLDELKMRAVERLEGPKLESTEVEDSESEPSIDSDEALADGVPIEWVGAILSGIDQKHLKESVKELVTVADKYDFTIGKIILIGLPKADAAFMENIMGMLAFRGASVNITGGQPEEYQEFSLKRSPTWIVSTTKGEILLEGVKLQRFFNHKGEYVDPVWEKNFKKGKNTSGTPTIKKSAHVNKPSSLEHIR